MYCVFVFVFVVVVIFSDLYCVFVVVVVVGVVSVIFGAEDRKQERKKTLFYTVRSEQLLLRTRELLFICFRILLVWRGCCSAVFSIFCYNWVFLYGIGRLLRVLLEFLLLHNSTSPIFMY